MKLGLCLSGGGIKAAAHIGAIKALEEDNIKFDYISGTSSGSIVATLYAIGFTVDEIYYFFKKYAKQIKYVDSKNICNFGKNIFLNHKFKLNGLNSGESIYKLMNTIAQKKGISNINQIKMPLIIPAVNIYNEQLYVFCSKNVKSLSDESIKYINDVNIGTAVQASCSFPGVFSPCDKYENALLIDGGTQENVPWRETKKVGADKVLSIAFVDKYPKKCCDNVFEILIKSFKILSNELSKYEWNGADYLLKIRNNNVGLLNTKKIDELYDEGYAQTKLKIKDIKEKLNI